LTLAGSEVICGQSVIPLKIRPAEEGGIKNGSFPAERVNGFPSKATIKGCRGWFIFRAALGKFRGILPNMMWIAGLTKPRTDPKNAAEILSVSDLPLPQNSEIESVRF
jgi:hypothetical protein